MRSKFMLNEEPNSNDATLIVNNVCLTTIGAQLLSMVAIIKAIMQKS